MFGNEDEVARAVDRNLNRLGGMRRQGDAVLREADIQEALRRAAILRNAAFRAAVRRLLSRRRRQAHDAAVADAAKG